MGFSISVNREKCKRDGICVSQCPERAIEIGEDGYPRASEFGEIQCIGCGHCVSFCPEAAFTLVPVKPEQCEPVKGGLSVSAEQMGDLILSRRSIRIYKSSPVPRETIEKIIDLARYSPTAKNLQPVHWTVLEGRDTVKRFGSMVIDWLRDMSSGKSEKILTDLQLNLMIRDSEKGGDWVCRGAPNLIVAHGPTDLPIPTASMTGCIIALTTLELAARTFGLGACWAGYFSAAVSSYAPLKDALKIPKLHECYGAMMIGYAVHSGRRLPLRKEAPITWI